jgi:hypothetical protein
MFLITGVSIILITLFTVSFQSIKAAITNPAYNDSGMAIKSAINTSMIKSFDSIIATLLTDAPTTFCMPISFCLLCAFQEGCQCHSL